MWLMGWEDSGWAMEVDVRSRGDKGFVEGCEEGSRSSVVVVVV